jgi:hypothetical protein
MNEPKKNLKCDKTLFGFRRKCIKEKCAMWVELYSQNDKKEMVKDGMCVQKANNIILADIARGLFAIAQKPK